MIQETIIALCQVILLINFADIVQISRCVTMITHQSVDTGMPDYQEFWSSVNVMELSNIIEYDYYRIPQI